jgi:hypothetical protein
VAELLIEGEESGFPAPLDIWFPGQERNFSQSVPTYYNMGFLAEP